MRSGGPQETLHGGRRTAACRRLWTTSTPVDNRYGPHPSRTALMWGTSGEAPASEPTLTSERVPIRANPARWLAGPPARPGGVAGLGDHVWRGRAPAAGHPSGYQYAVYVLHMGCSFRGR